MSYTCIYMCVCMYICVCIHTHVYACMYAYIETTIISLCVVFLPVLLAYCGSNKSHMLKLSHNSHYPAFISSTLSLPMVPSETMDRSFIAVYMYISICMLYVCIHMPTLYTCMYIYMSVYL